MAVKLWSPAGDCHIGLTSGHTFLIPADKAGIEVPQKFRREAIARGCLPVGMEPDEIEAGQGFDRQAVIKSAMNKMMDSSEDGMFTSDGRPVLAKLAALCGFAVDRSEANRVWDQMQKDDPDSDAAPDVVSIGGAARSAAQQANADATRAKVAGK